MNNNEQSSVVEKQLREVYFSEGLCLFCWCGRVRFFMKGIKMISQWKHPNYLMHFLGWLQGFCELADGLVTIFSLGFCCSRFEMNMAYFRAKMQIRITKRNRNSLE